MPSALPDPVLALSMDNVQKLNDLDLDQLANLWNVFTKCKESLESGRRLENLSWRLWFREAHLLPPDVALSDLTDFTPLDSPLLSRANSVAGSYQHSRLASLLGQASAALSDPEPETETSESSDSETPRSASAVRRRKAQQKAKKLPATEGPKSTSLVRLSPRRQRMQQAEASPSSRTRRSEAVVTSVKPNLRREPEASGSSQPSSEHAGDRDSQWDRQRAVSSSSAFGSRARVKQRNQSGSRRRPLSFQTAIESLYLDRNRDELGPLARPTRPSLSRMASDMIASTGAIDAPQRQRDVDAIETTERFSAPAEYSSTAASSSHSQPAVSSPKPAQNRTTAVELTPNGPQSSLGHQEPQQSQQYSDVSTLRSEDACHAPETAGPISPSKMEIATVPTIGAISRQPSASRLDSMAQAQSQQVDRREEEAAKLMPPPSALPGRVSAAADAQASSVSAIGRDATASDDFQKSFVAQQNGSDSQKVRDAAGQIEQRRNRQQQATSAFYVGSVESSGSVSSQSRPNETISTGVEADSTESPGAHAKLAKGAGTVGAGAAGAATKGKGRDSHATALHAGHRSKSSTGLHRDHRHHKSHDKLPVKRNSQARLGNVFSGLTMTKAAPAPQKTASAATTVQGGKKKPVQFTMGGDDSDSFEDEDDLEDEPVKPQTKPAPAPTPAAALAFGPATAKKAEEAEVVEVDDDGFDDDDGDWASDPEAEEAERKAQAAAQAERKRREEDEHQKAMFKKIPIRSKSAADVRLMTTQEQTSAGPSPPAQPIRGLLSSLFHPDEQHSPPGQLAGRPHASAADLRAMPSVANGPALFQKAPTHSKRTRGKDAAATSTTTTAGTQSGPFTGGIRASKSAVALPLLNTSVTRSSTGGSKSRQQQSGDPSRSGDQQAYPADDGASTSSHGSVGGKPSSVAMAKLNALAQMRSHVDRRRSNDGMDAATRAAESRTLRLEVSPSNDDEIPSQTGGSTPRLQHQGMGARSKSEMPSGPMPAPALARHRSSIDLPETAAPQTPRTTRRNMLRDELSESLRQNLLWERQSRTRMMGIGAPVTKKETVLGGNQLRPLTSTQPAAPSSSKQVAHQPQSQQSTKPKRYSEEWGSFHHKGW